MGWTNAGGWQQGGWGRVAVGGAPYAAQIVGFDGTNDYMNRGAGLTGAANGKQGIFSMWFKMTGNDNNFQLFLEDGNNGADGFLQVLRMTDNTLRVSSGDGLGGTNLQMFTSPTYATGMSRSHFLAAWDLAAGFAKIYVNDADVTAASPTIVNANINYSVSDVNVGARVGGSGNFITAEVSDYYLNTAEFLDITVSANRRKFITAGGGPVDLGATGSIPTGTAPIMFFHGSFATWNTNDGTGGGFTLNGGGLTDGGTFS